MRLDYEPVPDRPMPLTWRQVFTSGRMTWRGAVIVVVLLAAVLALLFWMMDLFPQE